MLKKAIAKSIAIIAVILAVVLVLAMVTPALAQTTVVEVTADRGGPQD